MDKNLITLKRVDQQIEPNWSYKKDTLLAPLKTRRLDSINDNKLFSEKKCTRLWEKNENELTFAREAVQSNLQMNSPTEGRILKKRKVAGC